MRRIGTSVVLLLLMLLVSLAIWLSSSQASVFRSDKKYLSERELKDYGRSITVRVFPTKTPRYGGSGVLIKRDEHLYTVVTNDHVINNKTLDYQIQTLDDRIYNADILKLPDSENDVGFLVFSSPNCVYPVASSISQPTIKKRSWVMAGGFPFTQNLQQSQKFKTNRGIVAEILNFPFIGGYQIGYSNNIINGMSGGPLLNYYGELIGINGLGKEPLFGNPYIYQDGSTVSEVEYLKFSRLSWAVPIQTIKDSMQMK